MSDVLKISRSLSLPLDAMVKRHFVVGQSGSGKTYGAMVLFEEFAKTNQPVVAIDPKGDWWGLRSSATGKGDGLPVIILGGEHGDLPLEPTAGRLIADFIVQSGHSFVLDLSFMRRGQRTQFMFDFCERIYEAKTTRKEDPLHILWDEADMFAPETRRGDKGLLPQLVGAMEDLARRGRSLGIGQTWITQRPAVINKSVIAQADVLHIYRLSHPTDRDSLNDWVKANATAEQMKAFAHDVATLEAGHCLVWSPQWLKIFKKVHVRERETFDSSKTPEVGVKIAAPKVMTKVDIDGLRSQLETTIEVAKAEDPAMLRAQVAARDAQIVTLKRELERAVTRVPDPVVTTVERPVLDKAVAGELRAVVEDLDPLVVDMRRLAETVALAVARLDGRVDSGKTFSPVKTNGVHTPAVAAPVVLRSSKAENKPSPPAPPPPAFDDGELKLRAGERAILVALGQRRPEKLSRTQIGVLVCIAPKGTTLTTYLGILKKHGLIEQSGELYGLTAAGLELVGHDVGPTPTRAQIIGAWSSKLRAGERAILEAIASEGELTRAELEPIVNIDAKGTTMTTYLGILAKNALITKSGSKLRLGTALAEAS